MVYVFDTNSFKVLNNYFPQNFPTVWNKINLLVLESKLLSVNEVFNELQIGGNSKFILDWVKLNKKIFLKPNQDEMLFIRQIFDVKHFQDLVSQKARLKGTPVADPFIIACAKVKDGCVVTEEAFKPNAARIPNVCKHFNVECINVEGLMQREGWRF